MQLRSSLGSDPFVAVVLVNWNSWRDCIECIDTVLAQQFSRFHIFVVDNASQDHSVEQLQTWCASPSRSPTWRCHDGIDRWTTQSPGRAVFCVTITDAHENSSAAYSDHSVTLIRSKSNLGFAGGCNLGIAMATLEVFDYFWLLNTDTVVHRDALHALVARAQEDANIGMVGSTIRYYDRPDIIQAMGGAHLCPEKAVSWHLGEGCTLADVPDSVAAIEREMTFVFGASMLVSRALIREVGMMTEDYFLYYEEIDWAMRSRAKFKLGYAANSHVYHKSGNSSAKVLPTFAANYYYRNRLRFTSRFFPQFLGAAKRTLLMELLRTAAKGQWSRTLLLARILLDANAIAVQAIDNFDSPTRR
jgi:GT2 family glycosyltransferase